VHAWLSDPEGSKARERKRRYRAVCVDCGGPCYRQGPYVQVPPRGLAAVSPRGVRR